MRIIQGGTASLLVAGACAWICCVAITQAGGPSVRSATTRTLLLSQSDAETTTYPRMSPIPTYWDSAPQLLPTELDAQIILLSHMNHRPATPPLLSQMEVESAEFRWLKPIVITHWHPSGDSDAGLVSHLNPTWTVPTETSRVTTSTRTATVPRTVGQWWYSATAVDVRTMLDELNSDIARPWYLPRKPKTNTSRFVDQQFQFGGPHSLFSTSSCEYWEYPNSHGVNTDKNLPNASRFTRTLTHATFSTSYQDDWEYEDEMYGMLLGRLLPRYYTTR